MTDVERTPEQWFGVRVRREREKRDWTQAELARRMEDYGIKLHVSAIAKIESGSRAVRLNEAATISRVMEVELGDFVRAPASEWSEASERLREALALHRNARLIEREAFDMMRALGADFGNDAAHRVARHPAMGLAQVLASLDEFSKDDAVSTDG